jgi:hypothetical protein
MRFRPFAGPSARSAESSPVSTVPDELPSIDDFIDELPPIEIFLAEEPAESSQEFTEVPEPAVHQPLSVDTAAQGWAEGDWQSYDWDSLSSLGRHPAGRPTAAESWGESEWPSEDPGSVQQPAGSASAPADEVADALEGMARRIRSGELVIDNLHGTSPEAAMAAALTVLLRMRG